MQFKYCLRLQSIRVGIFFRQTCFILWFQCIRYKIDRSRFIFDNDTAAQRKRNPSKSVFSNSIKKNKRYLMKKKLRICIDLDGTICDIRHDPLTYADVKPKAHAAEKISELRKLGHYIIINTARNMGSTGHNIGKVMKNVGKTTLEWLDKNGIEYDEIFFGKPNADITIDDRAIRFESWDFISSNLLEESAKEK